MGRMVEQLAWGRAWLVAAVLAIACAPSACGDVVQLRRSGAVAAGAAITLQDVAALDGAYAQSLRDVVVLALDARNDGKAWLSVDLAQVRAALEANGSRMSELSLSGRSCAVRVGPIELPGDVAVIEEVSPWEGYTVADLQGASDVASMIVGRLARASELAPSDRVRVRFDETFDAAIAASGGARVSVEMKSTVSGGAALFGLAAYDEHGGVAGAWTVRVEAQQWRGVLRMARTVNRRGTVSSGDVEATMEWVNLGEAIESNLEQVVGAEARVRLGEGELVRVGQLQPPLAIRRGDLVQVHCLSGGLVVRGRGRAMANGRVGELIECKLEGAERSFLARVDGPGRVVMEAVSAGEPVAGAQ